MFQTLHTIFTHLWNSSGLLGEVPTRSIYATGKVGKFVKMHFPVNSSFYYYYFKLVTTYKDN